MHRERDRLFPDEEFADLFDDQGRRSVPPSVVATVMVLQRLEGLSDREAVDRYCFDNRWRYATGVGGYDTGGWTSFSHTVLVDMRERLRRSERPDRIFDAALYAAKQAGIVGRRRALDSTPLYDAVATMDTVTLIRSGIRALLKLASRKLGAELQAVLTSGDDYASSSKPQIDWEDAEAREALIDSRAKDAYACLGLLDGQKLDPGVTEAAKLLATVTGQDLAEGDDGVFRVARKVAKDRVISTVDPEARHGHKTKARSFDGYKGHVAVDPDSEIITATVVTPGNAGDASVAEDLISELLVGDDTGHDDLDEHAATADVDENDEDVTTVYGDNAYGTGAFQERLEAPASTRAVRLSSPPHPADCSPRTASSSTSTTAPSPVPAGVTVEISATMAWPTSATPVPTARCGPSAPPRQAGAPSGSAPTNKLSPAPACTRPNKPGATTTVPPVPRSNASSLISSTASTEEGAPACAAPPRSTPTSGYWPVPGTSRASCA